MAVGADGQHPGRVARRRDGAVLHLAGDGVLAEVAGRGHDDDARVDDALGRERQRVGLVRLRDRRANREVDDADVVGVAVRDDPVERRDDVADVAAAMIVEDLQADQVRRRGHAGARAIACHTRCPR